MFASTQQMPAIQDVVGFIKVVLNLAFYNCSATEYYKYVQKGKYTGAGFPQSKFNAMRNSLCDGMKKGNSGVESITVLLNEMEKRWREGFLSQEKLIRQ